VATPSLQFEFDRGIISDTANFTIQHGGNTTRIPMSLIHGRKTAIIWAGEVLGPYEEQSREGCNLDLNHYVENMTAQCCSREPMYV